MEIGKKFKNIDSYNENMTKHIKDKLFWIKKVPIDFNTVVVDFGCADGTIISYLDNVNDSAAYIGYDISSTMIELAKSKYNGKNKHVHFTSSWDNVTNLLSKNYDGRKKILFLSSIIHEVYSYAKTEQDIDIFWDRVLNTGFDYIIVRDMMVSYDTLRDSRENDVDRVIDNVNKAYDNGQLFDFENHHGTIKKVKNLMHFLLKYRWKINWEREVNEDYFPIFVEDFIEIMKSYNTDYFERFRVKFLDEKIKEDFDIVLTDYTHVKGIFSKKKFQSCKVI